MKMKTEITKEERKYIDEIVRKLRIEVIKQMKEIPSHQFYGWKEKGTLE